MMGRTAPQQRVNVGTAETEQPHARSMLETLHLPLTSLVPVHVSF